MWGVAPAAGAAGDDDEEEAGGAVGGELAEVRALIEGVLGSTGYAEQRAAKMDLDDFMALLAAFNEAGVHFTNGNMVEGD